MYNYKENRKRERDAEPETQEPSTSLDTLLLALLNLGDSHAKITFEEELKLCCKDISFLWETNHESITKTIVECLLCLPHKTSKYILLVGLLFNEQSEVAMSVVNCLCSALPAEEKPWWLMGQILRVFSELATIGIISAGSLAQMIGMYTKALPDVNALLSLHYGLPYAFKILSFLGPDQMANITSIVTVHLEKLKPGSLDAVKLCFNYADSFKKILSNQSSPLIRIMPSESSVAALDAAFPSSLTFSSQANHNLPVNALQKDSIFDESYVDSWEETILYRFSFHILSCSSFNVRKCCEFLFAAVPDALGSPEKLVAQMLFGCLSSPSHRLEAESVLISACRHSKLFPSAMARCLLRLVDEMEDPSFDHFYMRNLASWFALHLNTFDFKWPWDEWKSFGELPEYSGRSLFLHFSFEYLGRLTYSEKLASSIPSFLHTFLPSQPQPCLSCENDSLFKSFVSDIKSKKSASDVLSSLADDSNARCKFFEALLFVGSKSFSHASVLIERYMDVLKNIFDDSWNDQELLLNTSSDFWKNHCQNFELIVEKLLEYGFISPKFFFNWCAGCLESSLNDSSMPFFNALQRFLPSSIIFLDSLSNERNYLGERIESVKESIIADKQIIVVLGQISLSLRQEQ